MVWCLSRRVKNREVGEWSVITSQGVLSVCLSICLSACQSGSQSVSETDMIANTSKVVRSHDNQRHDKMQVSSSNGGTLGIVCTPIYMCSNARYLECNHTITIAVCYQIAVSSKKIKKDISTYLTIPVESSIGRLKTGTTTCQTLAHRPYTTYGRVHGKSRPSVFKGTVDHVSLNRADVVFKIKQPTWANEI